MIRTHWRVLLAIFAALSTPAVASAQTTPTPGAWRRVGAIGAALLPGVALHGAGHFALVAATRDAWNTRVVDTASSLLLHAGYGLYFGRPDAVHGEAMAYYEHRHDGYAGGMFWTGSLSGTPGRVGAVGAVHFGPRWGLAGEVQVGSAVVLQLNVLFRAGDVR